MSKIAIVTFHTANNQGALIQAYALSNVVESLGHEVEILDYHPEFISRSKTNFGFNPLLNVKKLIILYRFHKFRKRFLRLSNERYNNVNDIKESSLSYDYAITGSDQVWNTALTQQFDDVYFLNFCKKKIKKVSYAASMGGTAVQAKDKENIFESINSFHAISVRELFVKEQLEKIGVNKHITQVVDPSLLIDDYSEIRPSKPLYKEKYLAIYFVVRDPEVWETAKEISKRMNLKIVNISSTHMKGAHINNQFLTPGEWIDVIANAEIVCTNSFHGTALSIVHKKNFFSVKINGAASKSSIRITQILEALGLSKRFIENSNNLPKSFENIEYANVSHLLENMKNSSISFLKESIRKK